MNTGTKGRLRKDTSHNNPTLPTRTRAACGGELGSNSGQCSSVILSLVPFRQCFSGHLTPTGLHTGLPQTREDAVNPASIGPANQVTLRTREVERVGLKCSIGLFLWCRAGVRTTEVKGQVPHTEHPQPLWVALTTLPNKGSFVTVFPVCWLLHNMQQ